MQKSNKSYSNSMNGDFDIGTIRRRADIVSVVGRYVTLRRQGRNLVGLCPFHDDHHPSLTVNAEKGLFHCFSCGSGGDIFDFVQQFERCGFHEAVRIVASICGIPASVGGQYRQPLAPPRAVTPQQTPAGEPLRASDTPRQDSAEPATSQPTVAFNEDFARMLRSYKPDDDALADTYARFGVGLAPDQGMQPCYAFARGRLVFPIVSHDGRLVAFAARSMARDDSSRREPKYINSPNSTLYCKGRILYGFHQARQRMTDTGEVYLVEGYKDCLAMHAAGFVNTVAICGTSLTDDHIETLRRVVGRVFMMLDTDEAGRSVTANLMPRLKAAGIEVRDIMSDACRIGGGSSPDTETAKSGNGEASMVGATAIKPTDGMKDPDEMFRRLGCSAFANEVRARSLDRERHYIEQLLITAFILWPDTQAVVRESLNELLVAAIRRELKATGRTRFDKPAVGVLDVLLKEYEKREEAGAEKENSVGEGLPATDDTSGTEEPLSAGGGAGESSGAGSAGDTASPDRAGEEKPEWMFDAESLVSRFGDELRRIYDFFTNAFMSEAERRSRITVMLLYTYLEPLVSTELMAAVTRLTDKPAAAAAETSTVADENKVAATEAALNGSKVADAREVAGEEDVTDDGPPTADANMVAEAGTIAYKSKISDGSFVPDVGVAAETGTPTADGNVVADARTIAYKNEVADGSTDTGAVVDAEEVTDDGTPTADRSKVADAGTVAYKNEVADGSTDTEAVADAEKATDDGTPTANGYMVAEVGTVAYKNEVADRSTDTGAVVDVEEVTNDGTPTADGNESDTSNDYRKVQELLIYLRDIAEYLKRVA